MGHPVRAVYKDAWNRLYSSAFYMSWLRYLHCLFFLPMSGADISGCTGGRRLQFIFCW